MKEKIILSAAAILLLVTGILLLTGTAAIEGKFYRSGALLRSTLDEQGSAPAVNGTALSENAEDRNIGSGEPDTGKAAAMYKGQPVLWTEVEYARNTAFMFDDSYETTDRAIVDRLIRGMILVEEAEARGIAATQEEIDEMISNTRLAYEIPEGKEMIDDYCRGLEVSFEEYLEILASQAYETISMQKMRDQIAKELCAQSGVEYAKNDLPEEIAAAVDVWLNSLVPSHQNEITYYF